jgi:integrase
VTAADVAEFRADWATKPNMGNRHLSVLRAVFDWALERRLVTQNPCVGIKRHAEKKRTRLISHAELAAIYAQSGERLQVIIDLSVTTGQRITDVLRIRRSDITDDGIRFAQQKTGARLVVRWTPRMRDAVRRAAELQGSVPTLTLLRNRRGKAPDYRTIRLQWDTACQAAGITDAHLHDLRALAATAAQAQGLDAQQLLGHRTQANTARYLRDRSDMLVDGPSIGQLWNIGQKP